MPLPAAHSVLWCLGVFVGLWGVTLIVRGVPGRPVRHVLLRRPAEGRNRGGDWRLIVGGITACLGGGMALVAGYSVNGWTNGPIGDLRPPIWGSASFGAAGFFLSVLVWALHGQTSRTPRCPKCLYDMAGGGDRCPECGFEAKDAADLLRPVRRKRTAVVAAALLLLSPSMLLVPRYRERGAIGLLPTTVLIGGFEWLPESWIYAAHPDAYTLDDRYWQEDLAGWQARWLEGRATRLATSKGGSARAAMRAMRLMLPNILEREPRAALVRLIDLLDDDSPQVRSQIDRWGWLYWTTGAAVEHPDVVVANAERLAAGLGDGNQNVQLVAASLLIVSPEHTDRVLEMFIAGLQPGLGGRPLYSLVITGVGMRVPAVRDRVFLLLRDSRAEARDFAGRAFQRTSWWIDDQLSSEYDDQLLAMMRDPDPEIAALAVSVVMYRGDGWLIRVLQSASSRPPDEAAIVRTALKADVWWLEKNQPALLEALQSCDPGVRGGCLDLLEAMAIAGRSLGAAMTAAISDAADQETDPDVRERALSILRTYGVAGAEGLTPPGEEAPPGP